MKGTPVDERRQHDRQEQSSQAQREDAAAQDQGLPRQSYANNLEIIRARWKTVCVAVKNNCLKFAYTSWDSISAAWKDTVRAMKRGRVKNVTDDGLGGYFYGVLSDYLMDDYWRNASFANALMRE